MQQLDCRGEVEADPPASWCRGEAEMKKAALAIPILFPLASCSDGLISYSLNLIEFGSARLTVKSGGRFAMSVEVSGNGHDDKFVPVGQAAVWTISDGLPLGETAFVTAKYFEDRLSRGGCWDTSFKVSEHTGTASS
jgi:hypothetical protein